MRTAASRTASSVLSVPAPVGQGPGSPGQGSVAPGPGAMPAGSGVPAGRRRAWTVPADAVATLQLRWDRGDFLTMLADGQEWQPLSVPLHGPTPGELASDFGAAQAWVRQWEAAAPRGLRLEHKVVGGRAIGANKLPCRAWIDSYPQLWALLGVTGKVRRFTGLLAETAARAPRIAGWMAANPRRAMASEGDWAKIIQTVCWIEASSRPGMYLRQVDVPGVDTKFIESRRGILAELLDLQLPADRIDQSCPRSDFTGRYRFRRKPEYVRVRRLGLAAGALDPLGRAGDALDPLGRAGDALDPFSELTVPADELAAASVYASSVYVVENEITYLALPPADDAVVMLGGGYALSGLKPLTWLHGRDLIYWGDIDTHGFAILNRLRQTFPHARSMLMDRVTLLAHETQWVREPKQLNAELPLLDGDEAALYRDLVEDALGPSVRLEQERVSFSAIERALLSGTPRAGQLGQPA
jgi:hypothetical protein